MGIFSRFFDKKNMNTKSYIRGWTESQKQKPHVSEPHPSPESLFVVVMCGLVIFGKKDSHSVLPAELKGIGLDASENYSGDAALFELASYLYFRIDLWLYVNNPKCREKISTVFVQEFVRLFSQAMNSSDVEETFSQRVSGFATIAKGGAGLETYHHHLSQLILRSKDGGCLKQYEFESAPLTIAGYSEDLGVKIALGSWEESVLPSIIDRIKNYCDVIAETPKGEKHSTV